MLNNTVHSLQNFIVVLVKPSDPRNIGFVCRAMKTMGFTRLRIVSPKTPQLKLAQITAVHAKDLLENYELFPDLAPALKDTVLAAGITRRRGKMRKYFSFLPEEFAAHSLKVKQGKIALVFGTEEYGLTDEELSLCQCAVHIPSSPLFPSLNLSHAVQIICYTIFRQAEETKHPAYTPLDNQALQLLINHIIECLKPLNYFKLAEAKSLAIFLKDIFGRAYLSKGEAKRFETMFNKIRGLFIGQNKRLKMNIMNNKSQRLDS